MQNKESKQKDSFERQESSRSTRTFEPDIIQKEESERKYLQCTHWISAMVWSENSLHFSFNFSSITLLDIREMATEDKANEWILQAEKKLKSWWPPSSQSKYEDAADLFIKGANQYKMAKKCM